MTTPIPFAGCFSEDRPDTNLVFLGLCDDTQSTFLRGPALAPARLRQAYDGRCFNATTESGVDLEHKISDLGDLSPGADWTASAKAYRARLEGLVRADKTPFIAGGDHAVTIPVAEALAALNEPVHVVQIDAHPDLYPDFDGNRFSHACTGARLLELPHVATLTQLGIRTMNEIQRRQQERYRERLFVYEARAISGPLPRLDHLSDDAPVYLTIDMDGIDPAYAPGVSHPVPGGLSSRQVIDFILHARFRLVGMDVVEVNPARDVNDQTAILGARLLHEGMGLAALAERRSSGHNS